MVLTALWLLTIATAPAAELFEGHAFYVGDLHVHSGVSGDGVSSDLNECEPCEALEDLPLNAKNRGLDFVALTDHVNGNFTGELCRDEMGRHGNIVKRVANNHIEQWFAWLVL